MDAGDRHSSGVSDRLLRMSCGLEDVEDLWSDLDRALGPVSVPPAGGERPPTAGGRGRRCGRTRSARPACGRSGG
ncbi:PLP-dependent transferase [Streptomyces flavofungini]|uniref:PLP-dependent transferase n=1 Tax=Streptomyces flavofungini TaxID=68200 RepID=UPI003F81954C